MVSKKIVLDENLKKLALKMRAEGHSVKKIIEQLGVSKPTLYRWFKEFDTKNDTAKDAIFETVKSNWHGRGVEVAEGIAEENSRLRSECFELLKSELAKPDLNVRAISSLSLALERHTEREWKTRGLDYLDINRAIEKLTSAGYEIVDPGIPSPIFTPEE